MTKACRRCGLELSERLGALHQCADDEATSTKTAKCEACTTGKMAGPIPGTLANGERCDTCEVYATDREAGLAAVNAELVEVCKSLMNQSTCCGDDECLGWAHCGCWMCRNVRASNVAIARAE